MKNKKYFFRSFIISGVIFLNLLLLIMGFCTAYENIQEMSTGKYKPAIEISNNSIRIFDFEIKNGETD